VKVFKLDGQLLGSWGSFGVGNGQFNNAAGVAVDPTWGYVAVADRQNNRVQRFTADGDWVESIGQGSGVGDSTVGHLYLPSSVAFDSNGRLWVVDTRGSYGYINHYERQGSAPFTYAYSARLGAGVCSSCSDYMPGVFGIFADISGAGANRIWATTSWQVAEPNFRSQLFRIAGDSSSAPPFTLSGPWGSVGSPGSGPDDLNGAGQPFAAGDELWVPESGNNRIHRYNTALSTPTSIGSWGRSSSDDGILRSTSRIAAAPDGSVFTWDDFKYRIQHFSASGEFLGAFGGYDGDDPFVLNQGVTGIAVRADGEVIVSDGGHAVIKRFSPDGDYLGSITPPAGVCGPQDVYPGPLAIDAAGRIYMFDYGNSCVLVMTADGASVAHFGQSGSSSLDDFLFSVVDIAVNPAGTEVFVLDYNRVKQFDSTDGTTWTGRPASSSSLSSGSAVGEFAQPQGIDVDPTDESVYVSDRANDRIQRAVVGSDHAYAWTASGGRGFGLGDFLGPQGLAIDRWGNMWVSDLGTDSVKRIGDAPTVTLAALPATTTDATVELNYETTDPAAECDRVSGATIGLALGVNTLSVNCTNAQGSGMASVSITRTSQTSPTPPTGPTGPVGVAEPSIKFPKKLKLQRSNKIAFNVTCPVGCKVTGKIKIGKRSSATRSVVLKAKASSQGVRMVVSKSLAKKIRAALKKRRPVKFTVAVVASGAKKGKTGSAKLTR
jgi:sugar lactone lactonase YvrE